MNVLMYSTAILSVALFVQVIVWRIKTPHRQTKALLQIFFGTLCAGLLFLWKAPAAETVGIPGRETLSWIEVLHIGILCVAAILAYMMTYSAVEVDSPSLVIILKIAEAGTHGLEDHELYRQLDNDILVKPRLRDLLQDRMAVLDGESYRLTSKGIFMARLFNFYRRLVNIQHAGG